MRSIVSRNANVCGQVKGPLALTSKIQFLALGLLLGLSTNSASAQPCSLCPADAQAINAGSGSLVIFAVQDGATNNVNGQSVDACTELLLEANVSYSPNACDANGNPLVGAGFSGGTGHIILPNGTAVDVTPVDMQTTIVAPAGGPSSCTPPPGTTMVSVKPMTVIPYTLTPGDIAAGFAVFTFEFTNAMSQLPGGQGNCPLKASFALQEGVVAVPPRFTNIRIAASELVFGGSGGCPNGTYILITATNLGTSTWVPLSTNNFDAQGQFTVTNGIVPSEARRYFRLLLQ
jgi:hypothetical protein